MPENHPRASDSDGVITLQNALQVSRPELGNQAPVALFRLVRLVALEAIVGRGASGTFYVAGKKLGESLGLSKVEEFLAICDQLSIGKIDVQRFKGLGEMDAKDLKDTTMNPETRKLIRVTIDEEEPGDTSDLVERLMGKKPELRFQYIQENARFVEELDV